MSSPRIFTVEEVNALIPALSELVGRLLLQQSEIERELAELSRVLGGVPRTLDSNDADTPDTSRLKRQLRDRIASYEDGWREVQELGAIVKDPQIGLCDFYGRVDDKLVWLCWRYGEETLGYYHDLEAGYAGRRPLGRAQRERLLN
jgi:hypothetical protein